MGNSYAEPDTCRAGLLTSQDSLYVALSVRYCAGLLKTLYHPADYVLLATGFQWQKDCLLSQQIMYIHVCHLL
ncbi:hypothetical protein D3C73_1471650 [compost metagenome]